uniref:RBR-type E3 ubiquitin transferase n=1 Tax=Tetraselmis sp. GSL018 TaxID=582737 RepID=A0A061RD57_9CHLO|mmetsp:Transcript_33409/g.79208  ORF Transcript_33409/g.79208 Transcript_33409/m.79208 type:complete len:317 (-) Transcript_33409:193-1143(-)
MEPAHAPASCEQMRRWSGVLKEMAQRDEERSRRWLASSTQPCPKCGVRIQRESGCNHMTCRICGHHFCWVCLGEWASHSEETGGFYSCNRHEAQAASRAASGRPREAWQAAGALEALVKFLRSPFDALRLSRHVQCYTAHTAQSEAPLGRAAEAIASALEVVGLEPLGDPPADADALGDGKRAADAEPWGAALRDAAAAAAEAHSFLACAYVRRWYMKPGELRSLYERLQRELEDLAEALTLPLRMLPGTAPPPYGAARSSWLAPATEGPLPAEVFHALAVRRSGGAVPEVLQQLRAKRGALERKVLSGVFNAADE